MTKDGRKPASLSRHDSNDVSDRSADMNRREFMARSALLGVAAGAAGLGLHSGAALAERGSGTLQLAGGRSTKPIFVVEAPASGEYWDVTSTLVQRRRNTPRKPRAKQGLPRTYTGGGLVEVDGPQGVRFADTASLR